MNEYLTACFVLMAILFFIIGAFGFMIPAVNETEKNHKFQALVICFSASAASGVLAVFFLLIEIQNMIIELLAK